MRQLTSIFPHFLASHHPSNLPLKARMFFSSPRIAGFRDFRAKEAQVESENKEHATKKYGKSTKAFGKEATGGGFEVFIFKDCHLMGLGEFHRDVTRPHPKFDREVGEALKFSLLEVGEWLQNYGYLVLSVRESFPTLSAYLPCFSCLCTCVNIILALTAWQNKYNPSIQKWW